MQHEVGNAEGDACWRNGCEGTIKHKLVENCSCHINAPCSACTAPRAYCDTCDWEEEEKEYFYAPTEYAGLYVRQPTKPRPLDPSKIDWRVKSHSSSSQLCQGVFPPGTTPAEVEEKVRGTFGGRFESFGNGTFSYVAYTD